MKKVTKNKKVNNTKFFGRPSHLYLAFELLAHPLQPRLI